MLLTWMVSWRYCLPSPIPTVPCVVVVESCSVARARSADLKVKASIGCDTIKDMSEYELAIKELRRTVTQRNRWLAGNERVMPPHSELHLAAIAVLAAYDATETGPTEKGKIGHLIREIRGQALAARSKIPYGKDVRYQDGVIDGLSAVLTRLAAYPSTADGRQNRLSHGDHVEIRAVALPHGKYPGPHRGADSR